ncbi:MAG: oligosaccharide flippase family protein [Bacteroidetes bacterium]|nr:oligosaccharide flippase family protein [Bacteroidota bacterium]MBS1739300.1 oligosaccharide flippase family protein [Bacteroidota bacterium]MBS1775600.1 oligosaccharide flippase family protein [Bacteroidota bacterium]
MRRFFAKNLLFIVSLNLLIKPLWIFMIDRTVQNKVGHASYGMYQALMNLGLVFQILLDFGISNYNSTALAQNPRRLRVLFPAMLSARMILSLLYFSIVFCIGFLLGYRGWQLAMLLGVLSIQTLASLMLFIRSNASGLHRFKVDGLLSISDRLLMIMLCGFLLWYPTTAAHFKIEWFIGAQIVCYSFAILLGLFLLKRISDVRLHFTFDRKRIISIIRTTLPYASLIFLMSVYTRADTLLIERLTNDEQAGIYAAAYRLLDVGNMFGLMFAGMLLPIFGRMLAEKKSVQPIVQLCVNLLLPVSLLVSVAAIYFCEDIMHLLYKNATGDSIVVFVFLMIAFPAYSLSNVYSTLLTANGDLKLLNRIALLGVVVNLSLNFWLIPLLAAIGAAFAAFITQSTLALCFILFATRQTQLRRNLRWTLSFLFFALLLIAFGYGVKILPWSWLVQLSVLMVMGISTIFLFRFVSISSVQKLISKD